MPPRDLLRSGGGIGSSDDTTPAPAAESSMDCDVVHDEHDLKQFLDMHGQQHAIRQAAKARYETWSPSYRRSATTAEVTDGKRLST